MSGEPGEYDVWDLREGRHDFQRLDTELFGTKTKFWFSVDSDPRRWLFKYPRPGTGEHWAEKIAAELAPLIGLPVARVELARYQGVVGTASRSFIPHQYDPVSHHIRLGELVHGNELLGDWVTGYDKAKRRGQADHRWANIRKAVEARFPESGARPYLAQLVGLIVFDAWIGNTDRHHENWAFLKARQDDPDDIVAVEISVAPSYDHASSLGRELTDAGRLRLIHRGRVGQYVERGRGGIYWDAHAPCGLSPMALLRRLAQEDPALAKPWLEKLRALEEARVILPVDRVPNTCMTAIQKDFCRAFLRYTMVELRKVKV